MTCAWLHLFQKKGFLPSYQASSAPLHGGMGWDGGVSSAGLDTVWGTLCDVDKLPYQGISGPPTFDLACSAIADPVPDGRSEAWHKTHTCAHRHRHTHDGTSLRQACRQS